MPTNDDEHQTQQTSDDDSRSQPTDQSSGQATEPAAQQSPQPDPNAPVFGDSDDAPTYLKGKSREQIAQEYQQLLEAASRGVTAQQQQPQSQQAPQQSQQNVNQQQQQSGPQPPPLDLAYSNEEEYQRRMDAYIGSRVEQGVNQMANQYLGPVYQSVGEAAKMSSKQDPERRDVWERYEPEIVRFMNEQGVAPQQRNKQAWDMCADIIAGRHRRELARAEAERMGARGGTITEGGDQAGEPASPSYRDKIDEFWRAGGPQVERLKRKGLGPDDIRTAANAMSLDYETYIKMHLGNNVIRDDQQIKRTVS